MADEGGGGQIYPQHFRKQKTQNNFTDTRYTDPMECTHGCILLFEKMFALSKKVKRLVR